MPDTHIDLAKSVRLLLFDVFGTTVDWRGPIIAEGRALGRAKGFDPDWGAFADAWRQGYAPAMGRVRRGDLPWTNLDELHRTILDELLVSFGIEGLTEDEKTDLNLVWHRLMSWSDAVEGLARLRNKYTVAALSNGNNLLLADLAVHAGLPLDHIFSAEAVQHYKPDEEVYLHACQVVGVSPSEVLMVAAHTLDLEAAERLGMRTCYVIRPHQYGLGVKPVAPRQGRFDLRVQDFKELASLLGT